MGEVLAVMCLLEVQWLSSPSQSPSLEEQSPVDAALRTRREQNKQTNSNKKA